MIKTSLAPYHNFSYAETHYSVYHADKEEGLLEHTHFWNHATICHAGSCLVKVKNKEIILNRYSQPIDLPANIPHEIEALENGTVFVNIFKNGDY